MKTKHKSCKAITRLGKKCSRLASKECQKESVCTQHHKLSNQKESKEPKVQVYYTLDDGGNPFKVEIKSFDKPLYNEVSIYKEITDSSEDGYYSYEKVPLATYKAEKVFIGKDLELKDLDGNSILLEIDSKKLSYVHIGATVFSFTAYAKIIDYVSPAENSAYPFAIDVAGNCYLMIEDAIITINEEVKKILQDKHNPNPYKYYYHKGYIQSVYIGNKERYLKYTGADFDSFKKDITQYILSGNNLDIYFMNKDGEKELLTKEKYNSFLENFGIKYGFKPYINKKVIHKRLY
jgi:hypothetical protein